jgi:citronellyl-CoA dehydrogenase
VNGVLTAGAICSRTVAKGYPSMAINEAARLMREVSDSCLQFWGGMGYTWENPVSRLYRDGRLASIGGGADEVMLGIICKYMHTLPRG